MSLLLDALKRAEQAKKAKSDEAASGSVSPDLPRNKPATEKRVPYSGPERRELQLTDREVEATPPQEALASPKLVSSSSAAPVRRVTTQTPPSRSGATLENQQELASSTATTSNRDMTKPVAKQANPAPIMRPSTRPSRTPWLAPLVAVGFVAAGLAGWVGWQELSRSLTTVNRQVPVTSSTAPAATVGVIPSASVTTGQITAVNQTPQSQYAAEQALPPLLPPPLPEAAAPRPAQITRLPNSPGSTRELTERELLAQSLKQSPASREAPVRLRLSQSIDAPKVSPELTAAYAALTRGDYVQAKNLYSQVVQATPLNLDAQLGLAASSARGGDNATAARHYRRALELDPRNSVAIAGLLAVSESTGGARPEALEAQLKALISKDPNAAALQFSLGNLYAGERRWTEAQQAYFEAYRLDAGNADYLFNLAVSLDQLNQPRLAFDYYQKSLAQASKTGAQFDRGVAERRAAELQNVRPAN
jgi:tetratricopeptide (TPR) repeat protein